MLVLYFWTLFVTNYLFLSIVYFAVLESSIDNRHAQEIKTLAEGEMSLNENRRSGMSFALRGRMEKVRREIERLSTKPVSWQIENKMKSVYLGMIQIEFKFNNF